MAQTQNALNAAGPSGVFASRPTSPGTGYLYFATDLGSGVQLIYNGSKWKPVTGIAVLYCDGTYSSGVGSGAEKNFANYKIPGGLVSTTGGIRLTSTMNCTGTTGAKTIIVRHTTASGSTSGGTAVINSAFGGSAATLSASMQKAILNNASVSVQTMSNSGVATYGSASSTADIAGAINMASDSYLNFNINGNASDTLGFQGTIIEWFEG